MIPLNNKIRNIRFIAELAKFRLIDLSIALDCLKTCLSDFIGHNIELISNFIEACGPFMAKNLDSEISTRFNSLLDMTWRLKEKESLP